MILRIIFYYAPVWSVYVLLSIRIFFLTTRQQVHNSGGLNIIHAYRHRNYKSPRRVQTDRWRSYCIDLWKFSQQYHDNNWSQISGDSVSRSWIYTDTSICIQSIFGGPSGPKAETCLLETICYYAVAVLSRDADHLDRTHHQPYLRVCPSPTRNICTFGLCEYFGVP